MDTPAVSISFSWPKPTQVQLVSRSTHPELFEQYDRQTQVPSYDREDTFVVAPLRQRWELTEPLDDAKVLGNFALLEPQEDDVIKLVKQYGFLTSRNDGPFQHEVLDLEGQDVMIEELETWLSYLPFVYIALNVQHAVNHPSKVSISLDEVMHWWPARLRERWISTNGLSNKPVASEIETQRFHNYLLGSGPSLTLTATPSPERRGGYNMQLQPSNLLNAIGTLLIQVATGTPGLHRCAQCQTFFTATGHKDRMYCSNACKQAASRDRLQKRAEIGATMVQQLRPKVGV